MVCKRLNSLRKFGLKVNIYDKRKLKLGMNALLGVGMSIRGSYLVTMEWNGAKIILNHWLLLVKE